MSWRLLLEFIVSIAYGVLSSLIPIFNSEIYIVASQVGGSPRRRRGRSAVRSGRASARPAWSWALRRGVRLQVGAANTRSPRKPAGKFRTKVRGWSDRLLGLLGDSRWGVVIVFLSASVYVPPLYPVTFAVAETRMSVVPFGIAVIVGRTLLFLAIAFGISALAH